METQYKLYQTLQDRNNHIECELEGPFPCEWENTWIGNGFYFWFHHLDLALWWGKSRNIYSKTGFVVYESTCKNIERCWDLHANPFHQEEFMKWLKKMKLNGLINGDTTVSKVLEFIKGESKDFVVKYEAIRILGVDSLSQTSALKYNMPRIKFELPREGDRPNSQRFLAYFNPIPPVQVCLFNKNALLRTGFDVIYPDTYRKENRADTNFFI